MTVKPCVGVKVVIPVELSPKIPTRRWHGAYAEENAFAICPAMKWPPWLHMIPDMGYTPGLG